MAEVIGSLTAMDIRDVGPSVAEVTGEITIDMTDLMIAASRNFTRKFPSDTLGNVETELREVTAAPLTPLPQTDCVYGSHDGKHWWM